MTAATAATVATARAVVILMSQSVIATRSGADSVGTGREAARAVGMLPGLAVWVQQWPSGACSAPPGRIRASDDACDDRAGLRLPAGKPFKNASVVHGRSTSRRQPLGSARTDLKIA